MTSRPTDRPRVAIVGGGFAGTMVAANLLSRDPRRAVEVILVEREQRIGPGVAFGTWRLDHLLNVPAGGMSAWPHDPGHFVEWARQLGPIEPGDFAPRRMYGRYIEAVLADAERTGAPSGNLQRVRDEVVDVELATDGTGGARVVLARGAAIDADAVVLALGTPPPSVPYGIDADELGPAYIHDPWAEGALDGLPEIGRVLLLGTGLTMIDMAIGLRSRPGLELHAISRRGLLPAVHAPVGAPPELTLRTPATARSLVRDVRAAIAAHPTGDWRAVITALRPRTRELWSSLEPAERLRLLDRVGRAWDISRHRMAPSVAAQLDALQRSRSLSIGAGTLWRATPRGDRVDVEIGQADRRAPLSLRVDTILNCTGPARDAVATVPLARTLLERGVVRRDAIEAGLDSDARARLLNARGETTGLLAIGWLRRGTLLESTAVPELRADAVRIADEAGARACATRALRTRPHDSVV